LGREILAWRPATRSWCRRRTVSGRTSSRSRPSTSRDSRCSRAASSARSAGANRGLLSRSCRSRTVIWWRSAKISTSLAWSLIGSSRSDAIALVTPRYARRSSMNRHRHSVTVNDPKRARDVDPERSRSRGQAAASCTDVVFGLGRRRPWLVRRTSDGPWPGQTYFSAGTPQVPTDAPGVLPRHRTATPQPGPTQVGKMI
jgi:hypothetical protein